MYLFHDTLNGGVHPHATALLMTSQSYRWCARHPSNDPIVHSSPVLFLAKVLMSGSGVMQNITATRTGAQQITNNKHKYGESVLTTVETVTSFEKNYFFKYAPSAKVLA